MKNNEQLNFIIEYESGELSETKTLELFSNLIKTGLCWSLQGHYGRTAKELIINGIIDKSGEINWDHELFYDQYNNDLY